MYRAFIDLAKIVCGAPDATRVRLRVFVETSAVDGQQGWGATMRHKVLCAEHRDQGIAEGWVISPF
jgi:hypothetical protein